VFADLTHAYEDVRYGSLRIDAAEIGRLEASQRRMMAEIAGR
jgi:hypothetical protein